MKEISQGKGDQEPRTFSSAVNPAKVGLDNLASLRCNNTRFSGINNEVEYKEGYNTPTGPTKLDKLRRCFSMFTDQTRGSVSASSNEVELTGQEVGSQEQRDVSPSSQSAREEDHGKEGSSSLDSERQVGFSREAEKIQKGVSDNTSKGSNKLRRPPRHHLFTDSKGKSSSNEVELTGQEVGSQEQRDVSPSSQSAREEKHSEEGSSSLGNEGQVDFYVAGEVTGGGSKGIKRKKWNLRKKNINNYMERSISIKKLDNNLSGESEIRFNIRSNKELTSFYWKEPDMNLGLCMDWGDKTSYIAENKRDIDENNQYDVFISYNRDDEDIAAEIAKKLKRYNIKPWLRKWEIDASETNLVHATDMGIKNSKSMAVILGMHDIGKWQQEEIAAFFPRAVYKGCPIIPVYLSKDSRSKSSPFLFSLVGVNFYSESDRKFDSKKFDKSVLKVIWGINGKKYKNK